MTDQRRDTGMTLIELVVAMAIFALVAVMGLQGLSGMLHIRDRLTELDDSTSELSRAVALMRNDLTAIMPMRFFPPDSPSAEAVGQSTDGRVFSLSVSGQPALGAPELSDHLQRVEWRLAPEDGRLFRRVWTTLIPADTQALQPEITVMAGVEDLRIRSYWSGLGWVDGPTNPMLQNRPAPSAEEDDDRVGPAPENYSDFVPLAIEVTLVTTTWGEITLIETLK